MIDHYHNKLRYPEPTLPPLAWSGWRRKKGSDDLWQYIDGADRSTKGLCYQAVMQLCELVGGENESGTTEYLILPKGERPKGRLQ